MIQGLIGVAVIVIGIAASIALHEAGHLIPAKRFGVKVTQFMSGFGPTIWSRRRGETEYGLKAIPLGGFVRMIGMFPPRPGDDPTMLRASSTGRFSQLADQARKESAEEVAPEDADRVFYKLSPWRKIVIMLGGPVTNLVIASVLIGGVLTLYGRDEVLPRVSEVTTCVPSGTPTLKQLTPACLPTDPSSPAKAAGLQTGDTVVSVDGAPVSTWAQVTAKIRAHTAGPMTLVVDRAGQQVSLTATLATRKAPVFDADGNPVLSNGVLATETVNFLGMAPSVVAVRQPVTAVPGVVWDYLSRTASVVTRIPEKMVGVAQAVFGGAERDPNGPSSVVGVGRAGYEIGSVGLGDSGRGFAATMATLVMLVALLNLALFAFNLIPLLPLDGGQVVGAMWEAVKRGGARLLGRPDPGPVDVAKALPLAYAVSVLLLLMSVLLMYADIVKPISM